MQQGTGEMDLLPSSPTVPAGGSKHRRLGSYALPRTTEIPGSNENLHIESKLIQVIPYGERQKERDQYDLKQAFPRKSLTCDYTPHLRASQCCWGQRSLVAHSDIPLLRYTSKEQLRTRPRCVGSPLNFSPQPPSPAILHLSTCYGEYLGFKICIWPQDGSHPKHFGDFLSLGLVVVLLPTLHRSQPLPDINTRMTKEYSRQTSGRDSSRVSLYWVLLLSSSLI